MLTRHDGRVPTVPSEPPLVVHVLFRFDTGGLENGVVNLINHMPRSAYRHAVDTGYRFYSYGDASLWFKQGQ